MLRAATLLLLTLAAWPADQDRPLAEHQARLEAWVDPLAQKLLALLPDPIDGLDEFAPWDYQFREPPSWGCPMGCTELTQILVMRPYVVEEPKLVAQVEAAEARALDLATKFAANPNDAKLQAALTALERDDKSLKDSVRRLTLEIHLNSRVPMPRGVEGAPTRAGTLAGYPVFRFAFHDPSYEPTPAHVRLAVMLGPETFKNARVKDVSAMATEAKTAVVSVSVQSRTATIAADEAIARKLLERLDLTELAKLLTP